MPDSFSDRRRSAIEDRLFHFGVWYGLRVGLSFSSGASSALRETAQVAQRNILNEYQGKSPFNFRPGIAEGIEEAESALTRVIDEIQVQTKLKLPVRNYPTTAFPADVSRALFLRVKNSFCPVWPIC